MKRKIFITVFAVALIAGGLAVWYVFFKPHRNVASERAAYELSTDSLAQSFKSDTAAATKRFINKAVLIEGSITNIEGITVTFNNVACNVDSTEINKLSLHKVGEKVKMQGLVVGYNDLLEEIDLAQCVFK